MNAQQMLANIIGGRLAYLAVPLEGTVKREKHTIKRAQSGEYNDGKPRYTHTIEKTMVEVPAGYMVYFPRGHALRMSQQELTRRGLDQQPGVVSLQGLLSKDSAIGRVMAEQDANGSSPFADMEKRVIQLATAKSGPVLMPEQLESPQLAHQRRQRKAAA